MNAADFDTQFARLSTAFLSPPESDQLAVEWFAALAHYPLETLERAVTHVIRTKPDRFWPALSVVIDLCRGREASVEKTDRCPRCHGSTWMDADPFVSNDLVYANTVIRCPDCGVPPPNLPRPEFRRPLTTAERREHDEGVHHDTMPTWAKAKKPKTAEQREIDRVVMQKAFERLRGKLFPEEA